MAITSLKLEGRKVAVDWDWLSPHPATDTFLLQKHEYQRDVFMPPLLQMRSRKYAARSWQSESAWAPEDTREEKASAQKAHFLW